jgi:hypothetical protein
MRESCFLFLVTLPDQLLSCNTTLFCALILAQILHALHLRVAAEAGVDLSDVSLPVLVKLLAQAPPSRMQESLISLLVRKGRRSRTLGTAEACPR